MRQFLGMVRRKIRLLIQGNVGRRHALVGNPLLWKQKREFQIRFLRGQGLRSSHRLLDLGCGTLRGGMPIIEFLDTGNYTGLDVRSEVLDEARKELTEAGLQDRDPVLKLSAESSELPSRAFDLVWAFSVLIHMSDDKLREAFTLVSKSMKYDGVFYANVNIGNGKDREWQGFPVVHRPLRFYQEEAHLVGLFVHDMGMLSGLGHNSGKPSQDAQHMLRLTFGE